MNDLFPTVYESGQLDLKLTNSIDNFFFLNNELNMKLTFESDGDFISIAKCNTIVEMNI